MHLQVTSVQSNLSALIYAKSTLIAGLLIPKGERKRPQRNENSPEISLDFPCLTAAFPRNS